MKHKLPVHFEHYANPMVHPVTGETISSYKKLMNDPATAEVWQTAFGKDFGGMAQGDNKTGQKGTDAMFVMTREDIAHAHAAGNFFTYANPVVDYCPQKEDPYRIRITAGRNLVTYEGNASVRMADLDTAKMHWNSVISMKDARYMCLDIKNFYLTAKLEYFEYMKMPLSLFPSWIVEQYNLNELAIKGWVYIEMRHMVWGLPQAGILANKRLRRKLAPFGYHECVNTPGLWRHETRAISFTLVVDDFGVKYVRKEDVDHLIASIKSTYSLTKDWTGNMYCGITLEWDYENRHVNISMPGYIKKRFARVRVHNAQKVADMPLLTGAEAIQNRGTSPPPGRHHSKTGRQRHQTGPTNCGKHIILCPGGQYDSINGPQFHCRGTNKSNGANNGKMHTIIGLPRGTCGRESPLPQVRHDNEHSLGRLISFGSEGPKQGMRPFLFGVATHGGRTNLFEWGIPCHVSSLPQQLRPNWAPFTTTVKQA